MKRFLNLSLFLLLTVCSFAQPASGLRGRVLTSGSVPVPAASVRLLNTNIGVLSAKDGSFVLPDVTAGNYVLEISARGFATILRNLSISSASGAVDIVMKESALQLDEVTVSAQKREEAVQSIPASISTFSAKKVEQYRLWNSRDLTGIVPNLFSGDPGDARNVTSVRGITSSSYDPAVATYIDGVNQFGLDTYIAQLIDVERIEVLRGPQGTLYGRNALGGVINIITRQPASYPTGYAEVNLGNYGQQRYTAGIQAPLIKDKLFLSVAEVFDKRQGFYTNDFYNNRFDDQQSVTGNYSLRFQPNSAWQFTGNFKHQFNRNNGAFPLVSDQQSAFANPFHLSQNATAKMIDNTVNASFSINHKSQSVQFSAQTAYQQNHRYYDQPLDGDFSPIDGASVVNNYGKRWNNIKVLTQEIRFSSPVNSGSALSWTAGAYGFYQYNPVKQGTHFGKDAALLGSPDSLYTIIGTSTGKNFGASAFGQVNYSLTPKVVLTAGLRYDYEHKRQQVLGEYQPDASPVPVFETRSDTSSTANFSAFSPKIAVDYLLNASQHVYASYSRGFRAGGLTQLSSDPSVPPLFPYDPEFSNNFEVGSKNVLLDGKIFANLSLFLTSVSNVQVPTLVLPDAVVITRNAGKLTSRGVEIELSANPGAGFQIEWNGGYNKSTYNVLKLAQNGQVNDLGGKRQIFTPDMTSMLAAQFNKPINRRKTLSLLIRQEWYYFGSHYFDLANQIRQAPYQLTNSRFGFSYKSVDLMFWGRNLTDKKYISYAYDFGAVHLANPRTVGVTLKTRF